jgi:F-type H+-transporting ATPase subunit epsilon
MSLRIRVIAPDRTVWDGTGQEIILPSTTGLMGILKGHAPLLTALDIGTLRIRNEGGDWSPIALMGGFAEIENNQITILVNEAQKASDIDAEEADKTLAEATARMNSASTKKEKIEANLVLKRAGARVQTKSLEKV